MDIRTLSATSDHDAVFDLFKQAADYVMLEDGHPPNRATVDAFFNDRPPKIAAKNALQLGVFEDDQLLGILGMLFGYPEATDCYIGLLVMSPEARGRGVGAQALAHATSLARTRGAQRQLVAVLDQNPKGRAFWEREGFVLEQTFPPSDDTHIRHRMTREI